MLIILIPNTITNHGFFLYAGDYAFQEIPFYYHASDYVKNNTIGWDWQTDLGSDFLTSYGFYLIGSVFFWIVSRLSGMTVVYAMPVMLAFKTAVGALGAYLYISRYVKKEEAVFIGAYMYAFSGFQMTSLVFNHFHDVTALFPFLLLSFDLLVTENKKVFFAIMVAVTAATNYFFFFGIAVFVIIYYVVRCTVKDFIFSIKNFFNIVLEAIIGVSCAAIILVPTVLLLHSSERVGETLYGVDLVSYNDNTIIPKILQSLFLIPDPSSGGMLFKSQDNTHNWASISLYLPLFTITGVAAFLKTNKKSWVSCILKVCIIIALVPGLNSIFSMFNSSYYARWYYMPVLIMCLATAKSLESGYDLSIGIKTEAAALVILAVIFCLPNKVIKQSERLSVALGKKENIETEIKWFKFSDTPVLFWQCMAFSVIFLLVIFVYEHERKKPGTLKKISAVLVALNIINFIIFINSTISETRFDSEEVHDSFIAYEPQINDDDIYRIAHASSNSNVNYGMVWDYMNAGCFNSVEANEINDFYYNVKGIKRNMMSSYESEDYPAYSLLSVKYIFNLSTGDDLNVEIKPVKLPGCSLYDKQQCYYIYKNDCYIPFGFMYDYCIDDKTLEGYLDENITENKYQYKQFAMLRALVLDNEDIDEYRDYIKPLPASMLEDLDEETYYSDCEDRRSESCSSFEYDSKGYHAQINTDRKGLVFFSVPCSEGWNAKVNGADVKVIKAHYGLTAVTVEPGENDIEFFYETPGLAEGKKISFVSLSVLVIYSLAVVIQYRRRETVRKAAEV